MQGFWLVQGNLSGSFADGNAIGRVAVNIIFLLAIAVATFFWSSLRFRSLEKDLKLAYVGTVVLLVWYVVNLIDLCVHEAGLRTTYSYIIVDFFFDSLRFASNIIILAAVNRIIWLEIPAQPSVNRCISWLGVLAGQTMVLILSFLTIYHLGSLMASRIFWLRAVAPGVVQDVLNQAARLETAFGAFQFLLALVALIGSALVLGIWRREEGVFSQKHRLLLAAGIALWIRAVEELAVISRFHLPKTTAPSSTLLAQDIVFGLCSSVLFFLLVSVARNVPASGTYGSIVLQQETDCRNWLLSEVSRDRRKHTGEPVPLRVLFERMKGNSSAVLRNSTKHNLTSLSSQQRDELDQQRQHYIERLEGLFGNLGSGSM